jgi:hypothetical protein
MEYFIRVDGGIGRCIASTGAILEFAKNHTCSVVSSHPYIFDNIGLKVYPLDTPYLYEDKISKGVYLEPEPYNDFAYYNEKKHLSQVFNKLLNNKDEMVKSKIVLTTNELNEAKVYVDNLRKESGKKILLLQPYASSGGKFTDNNLIEDETFRSMKPDFCDKLIQALKSEYVILQVRDNSQFSNKDTITFNVDTRRYFSLISFMDAVICVDSFLQHAVSALGNPVRTIVFWGGTMEKNLGYPEHTAIRIKEIEDEPNRMPHNHQYYTTKNRGSNDFTDTEVKKVVDILKS